MTTLKKLLRGPGPTAVLRLIPPDEVSAYALAQALADAPPEVLGGGQAGIHPILYHLEAKRLVASRMDTTGPGPARRMYRTTHKGRKRLARGIRLAVKRGPEAPASADDDPPPPDGDCV